MRVLIADDDHDGADILGLLFEGAGCEARVAYSGLEAIAVAPAFRPQLVVLDLGMPGVDGFETARRLRNEATSKHATYVAYTALPRSTVVEQFQSSPFAFFVQKPSDFDRFEQILAHCHPARCDESAEPTRESGSLVYRHSSHPAPPPVDHRGRSRIDPLTPDHMSHRA